MGHTDAPNEVKVQPKDFNEMKEVDVETAEVTTTPAPPAEAQKKKKCCKIMVALFGGLCLLLLFAGVFCLGSPGEDDDMDDMDARNKLCSRWGKRHGAKGGKTGAMKRMKKDDADDHDGNRDDGDDAAEDDEDAKKYCRSGGKQCGSTIMLTDKQTGEESEITVYAEEGGVKEVAESLSEKYDVMDPIPIPCAIHGKVEGDDGDDNDDNDHKKEA